MDSLDGYEYLESPSGSGVWFIRKQSSGEWEQTPQEIMEEYNGCSVPQYTAY